MQTRFVSSIILSAMLNIHTTTELKTLEPKHITSIKNFIQTLILPTFESTH